MRRCLFLLTAMVASTALSQDPVALTTEAPAPKITAREKWGLTEEQYLLVNPSRRPGGEDFKYWRARKRGPYGNLLEHVVGGPRRPVKF